jgi:uncharacterized membrane protein (UPF0127 family)
MQDGTSHTGLKFAASIVVVIAALGGLYYLVSRSDEPASAVMQTAAPDDDILPAASSTASHVVNFEVVKSEAAQEQGLGGRALIPHNYAMLFVFPKDDRYGFWMKDMLAPIDMIWVDGDHRIVKVDASVQPNTYPQAFYPPVPVHLVLETRAGEAALLGWTVGASVTLPKGY